MSDKEPKAWITVHGRHIPIFDKEVHPFVFDKPIAQEIDNNYQDNEDFDREKATEEFTAKTGITVDETVKNKLSSSSLQMVYNTISTLSEKYDLDGITIKDMSDDIVSDGCPAAMRPDGVLYINTKSETSFIQDKEAMDVWYKQSVIAKDHPNGDSSSIIAHEIAHRLVYKKISDSIQATGLYRRIYFDRIDKALDNKDYFDKYAKEDPAYTTLVGGITKILKGHNPADICNYADKDHHEMLAEAFADVYYNGSKANVLSKSLYKLFF